ncbi:hypothetical protein AMK09_28115 [Streptomyces sp. CB02488]|nr:hypothetical protein AMK09_28115 [Streptomyces sp. CB02488]
MLSDGAPTVSGAPPGPVPTTAPVLFLARRSRRSSQLANEVRLKFAEAPDVEGLVDRLVGHMHLRPVGDVDTAA